MRDVADRARPLACWALAVPFAAWALVRTFGLDAGYPLVPLMAYTPYVCLLAILAVTLCALLRQWAPVAVAGVAAIALVVAVAPRALGGPEPEAEGRTLRVMSTNLYAGRADADAIAEYVREREVELLAVQELTFSATAELRRAGLERLLPHSALAVREGVSGSGLYSRHPLRSRPLDGGEEFKQTRAEVKLDPGLTLDTVSVHPMPPARRAWIPRWRAGFRVLPRADEGPGPRLLLGDFNATLDHSRLRRLLDSGYADAADRAGAGLRSTWPATRRWPPGITIDHVLFPEGWAVRDYEVLALPGSDHRAAYAELAIPEDAGAG